MKPTWEREGIKLYRGNCLEVLASLRPRSAGLVITDPPYGNNYSTGRRKGVARPTTRIRGDRMVRPLLNDTAEALRPLLNDTAAIYWFAAPDRLDLVLPILRERWQVPNVLCWDKGNCSAGDLEASYGKQWEAIVYARVKRIPLVGGRDRDVLRFSRGSGVNYLHPTQKPVPLVAYLLGRHKPSLVLDPFMGSGTTIVAAIHAGRPAIGCELDADHFDHGVARIEAALAERRAQLPFWEKAAPAP